MFGLMKVKPLLVDPRMPIRLGIQQKTISLISKSRDMFLDLWIL